ncbi:MAG TPA: sn-glycerol-3-phosphate ABC transporter ATP-binding protein UgpC [Ideonella sp.]|jgi:multiple sugar transport system ATP-binding protein|nr:sn-glycerol-3-phosphate ABC transporter ATP-binding protein UgpC [Ideonella sp.]
MSRIELQGVQKRYGAQHVLRDIDLTVEPGEFCVFVGPSGCGKSTLLRLVAGLDEPTEGAISIGGRRVERLPPAERDVAMVFQSYALYPHMTAYENLAFGLRYRRMAEGEIHRRVREAARMLHLEDLLQRKPRELSGGQRQRVAIGRAIVRQPKVFLFDEPLSNLDASLRVRTRVELARLHRTLGSVSMIYVTHDQTEAMTLADKIVLLRPAAERGELPSIAQVGHPLELYHHPANAFVAGFIGSPAMNFLPATVQAMNDAGVQVQAGSQACEARVAPGGLTTGEPVTLGIRPEHVQLGDGPGHGHVTHVERLGEHAYVYLGGNGSGEPALLAKTTRDDLEVGDQLSYALPPEALHLFRTDGSAQPRLSTSH